MNRKLVLVVAIIVLMALFCVCLVGCNKQVFDVNYKFTNAYVKIGETWLDLEIKKWSDYEGEQLQLVLKDDSVIVVNSMNCILYNGNLPKGE